MNFIRLLPVILSFVIMSAHFSRAGNGLLSLIFLLLPFLLLVRRRWVARLFQVLLILSSLVWVKTVFFLIHMRQQMGAPWTRMAIILGVVALFTALSALVFESKSLKERFMSN